MKNISTPIVILFLFFTLSNYAQTEKESIKEDSLKLVTPKGNTSKETVTKIIRIKGPNGEEKIIKQEQVITKKSGIQLNPEDQDKTNQTAIYTPEEISIESSDASDEYNYSTIPDGTGYIITYHDESGKKVSKAKLLSNGYYLVNNGEKDNCLGHFDKNKNLVLEMYDFKTDKVIVKTYKMK